MLDMASDEPVFTPRKQIKTHTIRVPNLDQASTISQDQTTVTQHLSPKDSLVSPNTGSKDWNTTLDSTPPATSRKPKNTILEQPKELPTPVFDVERLYNNSVKRITEERPEELLCFTTQSSEEPTEPQRQ